MILGQYESKVATKHQIVFPKKFREAFGERVILTKGIDGCIMGVSEANWKTLLEGTEGKPFIDKTSHEVQRYLLGNAIEVELDKKGRCVLPDFLRTHAGITTDVMIIGLDRYMEIWDRTKWQSYNETLTSQIGDITERLAERQKSHE